MASIARSALLRQCAVGKCGVATQSPATSAFAPLTRHVMQSQYLRHAVPAASRVAAFHATGRKAILPPPPRTCSIALWRLTSPLVRDQNANFCNRDDPGDRYVHNRCDTDALECIVKSNEVDLANDPVPVPPASPVHGSYHWTAERLVSAALIPLTIAPFAGSALNPVTDAIFGALLIAHSHIGFQACITDYFPTGRVPGVRKGFSWLLNGMTVLTLVGLYEFETNDVGITEAVKRIWKA